MKKYGIRLLSLMLTVMLTLSSCGFSDKPVDGSKDNESVTAVPDTVLPYSYDGTTFTYAGKDFDITSYAPIANAITSAQTVGSVVVVECHINPKNSVYLIFDAVTEDFFYELGGTSPLRCTLSGAKY